jgi:poly-gamma-glutamate synthesis protein (capsule biosynthesis protein)
VAGKTSIKLFLAGDVMLGRGIDQILPHPSAPILHESHVKDARQYVGLAERKNGRIPRDVDPRYVWGDALAVLCANKPELRIVNLETSITTSDDYWPSKGINYRMHPRNLPCLTVAGIDCCVLANNHVMDWGYAGLEETLATLGRAGVPTVGAGANIDEATRPARFSIAGKSDVLVFGFADASSGVPDNWRARTDRAGVCLLRDLSLATAEGVTGRILSHKKSGDIVVVSIHWGSNWGYQILPEQRRFAHYLIDNGGVAVVHGHSSHHARPVEIYDGRPIIYGSGDLLNDYEGIGGREQYRPWLSPMYFVTVSAATRRLERLEIVPMRLRQFRLQQASAEDRRWLRDKLSDTGRRLATEFELANKCLIAHPLLHQSAKDAS